MEIKDKEKKQPKILIQMILRIEFFWYLEAEWDWSNEYDYVRSPRQFWRNKIFKNYHITHIFKQKCLSKSEIIKIFIDDLKKGKLIDDEFCIA